MYRLSATKVVFRESGVRLVGLSYKEDAISHLKMGQFNFIMRVDKRRH